MLCFFVLAHCSLYCSDFIDKDNVNLLMARAMGGSDSSNLTQDDQNELYYRAQVLSVEYPADITNNSMIINYINGCQFDYALSLGLPISEKLEKSIKTFYIHDSKPFQKYIGGHWLDIPELKKAWLKFYLMGAYFLLEKKYYQASCSLIASASEINASEVRVFMPLFMELFYKCFDDIKPPQDTVFFSGENLRRYYENSQHERK